MWDIYCSGLLLIACHCVCVCVCVCVSGGHAQVNEFWFVHFETGLYYNDFNDEATRRSALFFKV